MPNWCSNNLYVEGPKEDIARFKREAAGPTQSYNDFRDFASKGWPVHDDIRLRALANNLPEKGEFDVFSFHQLFPVPEDVRRFPYDCSNAAKVGEMIGEVRTQGGYGWEVANWGCKWGASHSDLYSEEESFLHYGFDTAWSPPLPFLEKVAKDWPTLTFKVEYEEAGMGFCGEAIYEDGEMTFEETKEMEWSEDEDDE